MKSVEQQCAAMQECYPNLRLLSADERICIWRGELVPYRKRYVIDVRYRVPYVVENISIMSIQPRVQVRCPILEPHPGFEDGPIPHVYPNGTVSWLPYLCLFDPDVLEWTPADLIADTTIPWAERWLLNYEFWLATGQWEGGGRHPSVDPCDKPQLKVAS